MQAIIFHLLLLHTKQFLSIIYCFGTAMEASRQQLQAFRANQGTTRPVLEEFIPIKHNSTSESSEKASNISSDKANWMTSAQLWSQANEGTKPSQSTITSPNKEVADIGFSVSPKLALVDNNKQRNNGGGGAFLPFTKERNNTSICQGSNSAMRVIPELALASVDKEMEEKKCAEAENNGVSVSCPKTNKQTIASDQGKVAPVVSSDTQTNSTNTNNTNNTTTNQTHRKARRCWSPDLHRRFVNALQMLGGSQGIIIYI